MACRGDCCTRVAQLEAHMGTHRLHSKVLQTQVEKLIQDIMVLDRKQVLARLATILETAKNPGL